MSPMRNTIAACCILAVCCAGCDQQAAIQAPATDSSPAVSTPIIETGTESGIFHPIDDAHHVVYVIDRSGSMADTFDAIRREVVTSFGRLRAGRDFHVIFYSEGPPDENPPQRLIRANDDNKLYAWKFVETVRAHGRGNPVPALERAFDVLAGADASQPGKVIHLISDGEFPDNTALLAAIRRRNQRKSVAVNTYLYGDCPPMAVAVMKRIAEENRGQYGYVIGD